MNSHNFVRKRQILHKICSEPDPVLLLTSLNNEHNSHFTDERPQVYCEVHTRWCKGTCSLSNFSKTVFVFFFKVHEIIPMWRLRDHKISSGVLPPPQVPGKSPIFLWWALFNILLSSFFGCGNCPSENSFCLSGFSINTPSLKLGRLWRMYSWPYPDKPPAHPQSTRAPQECELRDLAPASVRQKSEPCLLLLRGPRFLKHETPSNRLRSEAWEAPLIQGGTSSWARLRCRMLL